MNNEASFPGKPAPLYFCCHEENDLYRALVQAGSRFPRYESMEEVLNHAADKSGVIILADEYPKPNIRVDRNLLHLIKSKKLQVYIEYPSYIEGIPCGEPTITQWERAVISSDFFEPELTNRTILALHGCWYIPVKVENAHMVAARVAGYNNAIFGLPKENHPILFQLPENNVLISTSSLSRFITTRYAPAYAWKILWKRILDWLSNGQAPDIQWTPEVTTTYGEHNQLPINYEKVAFNRSSKWFHDYALYSIDWKLGAIEGYGSIIDYRGKQIARTWGRGDCISETALVFAYDWALNGNPSSKHIARQMQKYVWSSPDFVQDNPDSPIYGLGNWFERGPIFYGDDNARVILAAMASVQILGDPSYDEQILRCILANLRTTGKNGFRRNALVYPGSFTDGKGWEFYRNEDLIEYAPHYQAYLWACYLWVYALTGDEIFLETAKAGIYRTMEVYPDEWKWQNGFANEIARMLLPLSFLVRLEDTEKHRTWLYRITEDIVELMQPCGAIIEKLGSLEKGKYPPPQSNEAYGTKEASLIQENGDPAADLLYTVNWALLGLHEAYEATKDVMFKEAVDRLIEFLCRIQVQSKNHPYLDGAWMRSFDFKFWEYWGSSADSGWGAWCVETGWTNSWIASVLAMRQLNQSLFSSALSERFKAISPKLINEMFKPENASEIKDTIEVGDLPGSDQV